MSECGRCGHPVYFAEAVQAIGQHWHRACFVCSNASCSRSLDSRSCNDNNNKPYCNHCYKSLFGPKGVGYGIGSGVLSTATNGGSITDLHINTYNNNNNNTYNEEGYKISYGMDKSDPVTSSISYGVNRNDPVTSSISYGVVRDDFRPRVFSSYLSKLDDRFVERNGTVEATIIRGTGSLSPASTEASFDSSDSSEPCKFTVRHRIAMAAAQQLKNTACGRCGKTVYDAEKVLAGGQIWHKNTCFACFNCNKRLDSRAQNEKEGKLYCATCYARNYGPKGYGHGVGAGILQLHQ